MSVCLILLSLLVHPEYPLILAANRDEYYDRPTAPAHSWDAPPDLLAGRDLRGGGTWLGLRGQRWAGLTNFRESQEAPSASPSRGHLVLGFLAGHMAPGEFEAHLKRVGGEYGGFSLLYGQGVETRYYSNRGPCGPVAAGLHGLSNHLLDTPWPKVERGKEALRSYSEVEDLLGWLRGDEGADIQDSVFLNTPEYGTRCSTVLRLDRAGQWLFVERRYSGATWEDGQFRRPAGA